MPTDTKTIREIHEFLIHPDGYDGLGRLCRTLREHNVARFIAGDMTIELRAEPTAAPQVLKASDFGADLNVCQCGHSPAQHGDHGLCLMGCDGEKCEGAQAAAQ